MATLDPEAAVLVALQDALGPQRGALLLHRFINVWGNRHYQGAHVADVLAEMRNGDALLRHTEPFYEQGHAREVIDRLVPSYPTVLIEEAVPYALLALATIDDAMPDAQAVYVLAADALRRVP